MDGNEFSRINLSHLKFYLKISLEKKSFVWNVVDVFLLGCCDLESRQRGAIQDQVWGSFSFIGSRSQWSQLSFQGSTGEELCNLNRGEFEFLF